MGSRSHADLLGGSGDAVAALLLEAAPASVPAAPPSGTAPTERPPSPIPPAPLRSGPVSAWRPPSDIEEYHLIERVGRGGMGEVYRAHDGILDRPVAVKLISDIDPDPAARDRFMQEARAAARLSHPNVLTVYRVGEVDGRPYLITEFIAGKTLDQIERPVPWRRALALGVGLSRGLAAAHRRGVLHRDIKPGNAILTADGEVKLLDFGLAKLLDGGVAPPTLRSITRVMGGGSAPRPPAAPAPDPVLPRPLPIGPLDGGSTLVSQPAEEPAPISPGSSAAPLTDAGSLMGTPDYMAPEIWRGEPATRRSDVYSLGALLFELCAGRPPHGDVPPRTLPQLIQVRDAPRLADLVPATSAKLAAVIERCLRRDPRERFASGDELREALEQLELTSRSGSIPEGNPYRGLSTFEAEHRALFFGRGAEVGTLMERLRVEPLVVVAGASGVGKSSLCRAGVLCAVQDGALGGGRAWSVIRFVPGRSPLLSLGAALAPMLGIDEGAVVRRLRAHPSTIARTLRKRLGDTAGLVIFVDQLEELVTMSERGGAVVVAEVLGHLATGLPGVRLLMTLRGDFIEQLAALPSLGDEIPRALYFLKPLSPDGVRRAIVGPAHATGATFESEELVETLVAATREAEGGLPLLQFALAELWEARDQAAGAITAAALSRIGGVAGALARHADEVILAMTAVQRSAARRVLFALVSRQGTPVRRREDELVAGDPASRTALNGLVRGRLLVVRDAEQGPTYELAHEALIRGWETLRRWLDEQAEGRVVRQRLATALSEWERLGRKHDGLWGTRQLTELIDVVDLDDLHPRETAFVAASRRRVDRQRLARTARLAALPIAALSVWGAERLYAQHEMHRKVAALIGETDGYLAEARHDDDESVAKRREAFARFDTFDREQGEALWAGALKLAEAADQAYSRAGQSYETALRVDAGSADAQSRLGDVLYARALLADREHHVRSRDDLLSRLALYDPGGLRRARLAAPGWISIRSTPPGASVTLLRYDEDERRTKHLVPVRELGAAPIEDVVLPPGSYLLSFAMPGRAETRYPLLLARSERLDLDIPLPDAARVPEGYAYVAPGRFLFGSTAEEETRRTFYTTSPLHEAQTGAYLIAREETTYADWIAFLRALPPEERARRAQQVRSLTGGIELKELPGDDWQLSLQPTTHVYLARLGEKLHYEARKRRADQDWRRFPVLGVSSEDAEMYVAWLSSSGRVPGARLCTEKEWERAARGADDRDYPHGDHLEPDDANLDLTYGKDPLAFGPDEVGSHPASRSPFGVDDLCGNAWEWTKSSLAPNEHVLRGGGYYFDTTTSRIPNRQVPEPTLHDANLGLRVCVTFEP